ncbi:MAG TPA: TPM domain-containing protein, partial [Vicinamibacteria bacterium]|nr:TPM domain-containing protein [Vicinamibacteria bacterium]
EGAAVASPAAAVPSAAAAHPEVGEARMQTKNFLDTLDHDRIVKAIQDAEARSRGEVRVHVSKQAVEDAQKAAARQFEALGMTRTAERNGVLLFVAPVSQTFAIIGDEGIHARCGPDFWKDVAAAMETDFRAGRYTDGIVKGVARVGEALATHFPREEGTADTNELSDEVTED